MGQAIKGHRDQVVIAIKFGYDVDEINKNISSYGENEEDSNVASDLRTDLDASLKRLGTDYIDVYQLPAWGLSIERALEAREVLEDMVRGGIIRTYGWSTDCTDAVRVFLTSPNCGVVQQLLNIFDGNLELLALCDQLDLGNINRSSLGMGILTGKLRPETRFSEDDIRKDVEWFPGFKKGKSTQEWLDDIDAVRKVLTNSGRTLAQGALAWIWAVAGGRSPYRGSRPSSR